MATRLKTRQLSIPGGLKFRQPEINWTPRPGSFTNMVGQIIKARSANPHYLAKYGWSLDPHVVADELDAFNAKICLDNGWTKYITTGPGDPPPSRSPRPNLPQRLGNVVAGGSLLVEWILSREEAVAPELSEHRAGVCAACPLNVRGDLTRFFTLPASHAIRAELSRRSGWQLATTKDEQLAICEACSCPLKLKVHVPLKNILAKLPLPAFDALHEQCWIRHEDRA